jgi:hypothetical protein
VFEEFPSLPLKVASDVPSTQVLGPVLIEVFVNAATNALRTYWLADLEAYRAIKSPSCCNKLEPDSNFIRSVGVWQNKLPTY